VAQPTDTFTKGTVCADNSDKESSMSTLRLLKYHALEDGVDMGPNYFRAGAHADFDVLTLLFAAQAGLELCPGRAISTDFGYGDKWHPIACNKGEIVCKSVRYLTYLGGGYCDWRADLCLVSRAVWVTSL